MTHVKTESMNQINDYFLLINFFILNYNDLYFFILNKSIFSCKSIIYNFNKILQILKKKNFIDFKYLKNLNN